MSELLAELGLTRFPRLHRDLWFAAALAAGVVFWSALALLGAPRSPHAPTPMQAFSLLLWQPLLEELVFRGLVQGQLAHSAAGRRSWLGFSLANVLTSLLFSGLHLWRHALWWAVGTFVPSLLFGFFRDRHASVYPSVLLHAYYNTGYFLTAGFPP